MGDPTLLVFLAIAFAGMLFLSNRTRKQQRAAASFRDTLKVGDEVMTGGGLFGTIIDIDGDVITLESPSGAQTDWLRAGISKLATPPWGPARDDEASDDAAVEIGGTLEDGTLEDDVPEDDDAAVAERAEPDTTPRS
jgi:preprotein translocase subunit YajC